MLPSTFENFKSSWMLLTKDEVRTFDELTTQLIVFERNMKKPSKSDNEEQEAALLTKFDQKKSSTGNFPSSRSKKNDLCGLRYWTNIPRNNQCTIINIRVNQRKINTVNKR